MENYSDHPEQNEKRNIKHFEECVKRGSVPFFDVEYFEFIIDHYLERGDLNKAYKACDIALEQHPYSGDFLMEKAQILVQKEENEEEYESQ